MKKYDSRVDTYEHIWEVQKYLQHCINLLHIRSLYHDRSKLESPEVELFDKLTPRLKQMTYGSDEYKASLEELKVALNHHYSVYSHHPEHYKNGIQGMNLIDLVEMFCDWMAAVKRMADGDIMKSIEVGQVRFGYSDELAQILRNTVELIRDRNI